MKTTALFIILFSLLYSDSFSQIKKQRERYPDNPAAREEYDFTRLRDPATNEIPPFIAQKEFEFAQKLPKKNPIAGKGSLQSLFDWQSMGPINVCGRVQSIGIDVLNENNMLAGAASGGVWRSIDAGLSWVKVTLPNDEQSISAIVQDTRPGKESTWYYSTGELLSTTGRRETSNIRTHSWGNGIYKSTDNGASWNPLLSTTTNSKNTAPDNFTGIWNLAVDAKNLSQDIMYAACYGGIMRSSDGGSSWTKVLGDDSKKCFNSEIVIGSGGTIYAGIGSVYDGTAAVHQGIWRSIDGINWTKISDPKLPKLIRRTRLAVSASNDNILYCLTETPPEWGMPDTIFVTDHVLLKYTYLSGSGTGSGSKWEAREVPFDHDENYYNNSLGGYCLTLAVHPTDPEQVFIGGNNLYYSENGFEDAGTQIGGYTRDGNYPPQPLHPDVHAFAFSRKDPSIIFVGHDGGISSTMDYTSGLALWDDKSFGLTSAQIYHSSLDHGTPGDEFILSGLQDNSTIATFSSDPLAPWEFISGGDGMTTAISPGSTMFFGAWQEGNIECFYNDGFNLMYKGRLPYPPDLGTFNFFTNFIIEPKNSDELYEAETDHLWRFDYLQGAISSAENYIIDDFWTEIDTVYTLLHPQQALISTFAFASDITDRLFFGTSNGKVYQIDNAAAFPTLPVLHDISSSQFPKDGFVSGIEVDPINANEIIVAFSNYNIQSLFRTTDGGKSWNAIGGNLEEIPDGAGSGPSVRSVKILHTSNSTIYYVGTSVGLYSTTKINGAQTIWTQEGATTIGSLIVEALDARQSDDKVLVSTQGGGAFVNTESHASVHDHIALQQNLQVEQNYPNPFASNSTIRFKLRKQSNVTVELYNAIGEKISTLVDESYSEGSHTLDLNAKNLPAGNYFLHLSAGGLFSTKMITIVK
jgi:hypothetical protein